MVDVGSDVEQSTMIEPLARLAARPSVGKTAVSLEIAKHLSEKNYVAYFSIEMPNDQIVLRMLSSIALLSSDKIKNQERSEIVWCYPFKFREKAYKINKWNF